MKPSRLKRWYERHKDAIFDEIKFKTSMNLEVEIYLGRHLDEKFYLVVETSGRMIIRRYPRNQGRPSWFVLPTCDWGSQIKCLITKKS